jgi:hypothetical protein
MDGSLPSLSKISRFPEINELYFLVVAISERDQVPEIVQHDPPYYTRCCRWHYAIPCIPWLRRLDATENENA